MPATEQPGNSFRYLYWRLAENEFQQLCSALLRIKYDPVRCFPVGMADEGVDAISAGSTVYQAKWSSKLEQDPDKWLAATIERERSKIVRLVRDKGIGRYILMTSVAGTTTALGTGSIQKLLPQLDQYTEEFGIPVECWWQSDIDAEVDAAPDAVKWSYQEMLAGADAMRYLIHGSQVEGQAAQMRDTVLQVMATQWLEDSKIRFSQVDVEANIADLFVDVHATLQVKPHNVIEQFSDAQDDQVYTSSGALEHMLRTAASLTYLLGVPGQGKSTLGQYLTQIHRAAILSSNMRGARKTPIYDTVQDPKLPLRVDVKNYAEWLSGRDPFSEDDVPEKPRIRAGNQRSLEAFLAYFCSAKSGGRQVFVEQIQSLLARYPTLLVLDGLDEVADSELRGIIVEQINLTVARLEARESLRRFQVLITARPNASGLPEPDRKIFQTLRLEPLTPSLQRKFVDKWCVVNNIHGRARRKLRRIFLDRTALDHVAQLADNPMQLTILLFLIRRRGEAVPVSRTALYSDYMTALLDREVNRRQIEREQVPRVQEVTAFLGWHMHSRVEAELAAGRMTKQDIETTLMVYFHLTEGPKGDVTNLFKVTSDRFWALTSKVDGTFEFAVQPVREYFAARFLAEWAGRDRREPLPKQDVLQQLIGRTYWLNTARFYAGFASPNELAGLRYGLEEAIEGGEHPLQARAATWALLSDGVFANNTPVQRDVVRLLTDEMTVILAAHHPDAAVTFPRLAQASGGEQMVSELLKQLTENPADSLAPAKVNLIRDRAVRDRRGFLQWWLPQLRSAMGEPEQNALLHVGGRFGVPRLQAEDAHRLTLISAADCRAALAAGASPDAGTPADKRLLRAVLDGHCSDIVTSSSSEAGTLLRAMRPQWYHQLDEPHRDGPSVSNGHLWLTASSRSARSSAWTRLIELDSRYKSWKMVANPRGRGQQGTTEPWQNPARELTRLHGPSWLAAEIAIAGAASENTVASGSIERDGEPFGENVDYGTFVIDVHRRPAVAWWRSMHRLFPDSLSRRTWSLALIATARADVLAECLVHVDACLEDLSSDDFFAFASTSSRVGLSQKHRRRIGESVWSSSNKLGLRTKLVLAHFTANLLELDPLPMLSETELIALATPEAFTWPIARALTVRILNEPKLALLEALTRLGPDSDIDIPLDVQPPMGDYLDSVLMRPAHYPAAWVIAAERWRSTCRDEVVLEEHALRQKWFPKVPRM